MPMPGISILGKISVHRAVQKQKAESLFIQLVFVSGATPETHRLVYSFNQPRKIPPSDVRKLERVQCAASISGIQLAKRRGKLLVKALRKENPSLHITNIRLISSSLKAIKILTLFVFTF